MWWVVAEVWWVVGGVWYVVGRVLYVVGGVVQEWCGVLCGVSCRGRCTGRCGRIGKVWACMLEIKILVPSRVEPVRLVWCKVCVQGKAWLFCLFFMS